MAMRTLTPEPMVTRTTPPTADARNTSRPRKWKSLDATRSPTKLSTLPRSPDTDAADHRAKPASITTRYRLA
jgi:hypothetical protein